MGLPSFNMCPLSWVSRDIRAEKHLLQDGQGSRVSQGKARGKAHHRGRTKALQSQVGRLCEDGRLGRQVLTRVGLYLRSLIPSSPHSCWPETRAFVWLPWAAVLAPVLNHPLPWVTFFCLCCSLFLPVSLFISQSLASSNFDLLKTCLGLPWWRSGWESACQCRGHGFEPWSGKIPHAAEQMGPWATTEPARLEPVLRNKRGRDSERPAHRDEE